MLKNLSCKLYSNIVAFAQDKRGVTAIEYAIIGVAMSALVYTAFSGTFGTAITDAFTQITKNINAF